LDRRSNTGRSRGDPALRTKRFDSSAQQDRATSALEIAAQAEHDAQLLRAIMEKL